MEGNDKNKEIDNNESKKNDFENLNREEIKKEYDDMVNENFFSAAFARMGEKFGSKLDSFAKAGRSAKKKLKSTFSKENIKNVGNKIKNTVSDTGGKISNVGSSIKTKALGLRVSSNMNSFYMLKLKEVLENYDGSNSKDDFVKKITKGMQNYKEFVAEKVRSWLNNDEREKALESKINAGYNELDEKYNKLDYGWLEKKIPSFSKKIRIEILKKGNCIEALKSHLKSYGKIDPLWDILTRGSKITRSGALKSKTIKLLFTMTNSLSEYEKSDPMDVGIYSNSLMSYLLKNFKGKGEEKDQDWKLQCGLLLVRYSQQEGSYFDSLGKMVDERVNKIYGSISVSSKLVKLQKSCGTIQEMLDKASGSKKGTASIAIGVGMSYSNPVAIEVLKRVYTSKGIPIPNIADIQNNSGSIYELVDKIKGTINDEKITKYDTDLKYQEWFDSLYKIAKISDFNQILNKIKIHRHLKDFEGNSENFKKYMGEDYKKTIESKYSKTLDEYTSLLENLKKDLEKYSGEEFNDGRNPKLFEKAEKNLEKFKYMLSENFIKDEISKELKSSSSEKSKKVQKKEIKNGLKEKIRTMIQEAQKILKNFEKRCKCSIMQLTKGVYTENKEYIDNLCNKLNELVSNVNMESEFDVETNKVGDTTAKLFESQIHDMNVQLSTISYTVKLFNGEFENKKDEKSQDIKNMIPDEKPQEDKLPKYKECEEWLGKVDIILKEISNKLPSEDDNRNQSITESEKQKYEQIIKEQENKFKDYSEFLKEINDETLNERMNSAGRCIESYKKRVGNAKIKQ